MKLSEAILLLNDLRKKHGDVKIFIGMPNNQIKEFDAGYVPERQVPVSPLVSRESGHVIVN